MKKIVYVLSLLFMITACNGDNTTFENNAYKLRNAKNGAEITLGFDGKDKRFFGRSAINRYFGTYKTEGDRLTFGPAGFDHDGRSRTSDGRRTRIYAVSAAGCHLSSGRQPPDSEQG